MSKQLTWWKRAVGRTVSISLRMAERLAARILRWAGRLRTSAVEARLKREVRKLAAELQDARTRAQELEIEAQVARFEVETMGLGMENQRQLWRAEIAVNAKTIADGRKL